MQDFIRPGDKLLVNYNFVLGENTLNRGDILKIQSRQTLAGKYRFVVLNNPKFHTPHWATEEQFQFMNLTKV